jgi:hypothetical protein
MASSKKRKSSHLSSMFTSSTASMLDRYVKYCQSLPPSRFVDLNVGDEFYHIDFDNEIEIRVVTGLTMWKNGKGKTYFAKKKHVLKDADVKCGEFRSDDVHVFKTEEEAKKFIEKESSSDSDSDE